MSYRIKTHGRIAPEFRRVAAEELTAALGELHPLDHERIADAIHEARKHLKKLRALVQLLREPMGEKQVRSEAACYRDIGRKVRHLRDAQALAAALEKVARRFFEKRHPPVVRAALAVLAGEEHRARQALERPGGFDGVIKSLQEARLRAAAWKIEDYRWKHLASALRRSYRRAREAWRQACVERRPRLLHAWRRRTKELWCQLTLIHQAAPDFLEEMAGELEVLGEFLGDDHDLLVLREVLARHPRELPENKARKGLFDILALRREELLEGAFDLAGRVFAEPPSEFLHALEARRNDHRSRGRKVQRVTDRLAALG